MKKKVEEGEVTCPLQQPPAEEAQMIKAQQKKSAPFGASKGIKGGQLSKASIWKPFQGPGYEGFHPKGSLEG